MGRVGCCWTRESLENCERYGRGATCPPQGPGEQRARNILAGTSGRVWHALGGVVLATGDPRPSHWRAGSIRPHGSGREGDCRHLRKPSQTGGECTGERPAVSEGGRARGSA